ncbi:unnamed protein product [Periconia digitata]|uniref:Uncharacterized protein n=1 Tax=Periconia digitata TaxID=1303443 RepID=A0A9W4XUD6_9PLEO|nr:unnamed protein product [Periconia digitata]
MNAYPTYALPVSSIPHHHAMHHDIPANPTQIVLSTQSPTSKEVDPPVPLPPSPKQGEPARRRNEAVQSRNPMRRESSITPNKFLQINGHGCHQSTIPLKYCGTMIPRRLHAETKHSVVMFVPD